MYDEADYLNLSGLQSYVFCPRQWALRDIEGLWEDNEHTLAGTAVHSRVHNAAVRERRDDVLTVRGLRVSSRMLGVHGICDVVEFHNDPLGVSLWGEQGTWLPYPVEYKKGKPKQHHADEAQLCGQAMCLEEMLCCTMKRGALFYATPSRRQEVEFTTELRSTVVRSLDGMRRLRNSGETPQHPGRSAGCRSCSQQEACLPRLRRVPTVQSYMQRAWRNDETDT